MIDLDVTDQLLITHLLRKKDEYIGDMWWHGWLWCHATSCKVVVLVPSGVIGIVHLQLLTNLQHA
jgi:hypothetical protein